MRLAPYHRNSNHYVLHRLKERKYGAKITEGIGGDEEVTLGYYTFCADGTWYRNSNGEGGHQESWMKWLADKLTVKIKAGLHPFCSFEKGPLALVPLKKQTRKVWFDVFFLDTDDLSTSTIVGEYHFKKTITFSPKNIDSGRIVKKIRHTIWKKLKCNGEKHHYVQYMYASAEPFARIKRGREGFVDYRRLRNLSDITTSYVYSRHGTSDSKHIMRIANISDVYISACICYKKK